MLPSAFNKYFLTCKSIKDYVNLPVPYHDSIFLINLETVAANIRFQLFNIHFSIFFKFTNVFCF